MQSFAALFFYGWIIALTSNILDLSSSQPLLPDFSVRGDKALTICIIDWALESLKHRWDLGFTEAPIFFPIKNARFSTDHLYGHLLYAYPFSLWIDSPYWIWTATYQLNRLTIGFAAFVLCYWITSSFLASFIAGGMLIFGWHFGQISNTGLGWAILSFLFFMMHLQKRRWIFAAAFGFFYVVAALGSGYLLFFTPIAFAIVFFGKWLNDRKLPDRLWAVQFLVAWIGIAAALSPSMLMYKKFQKEQGLVRSGYSLAKFALPISTGTQEESQETDENERVLMLSRTATLQIAITLVGALLMLRKDFRFDGWQFSFALLAVFSFWMASFEWSPYRLVAELPGFNGLRAVQRWYLFLSVALTAMSAMTIAYVVRKKPIVFRPLVGAVIVFWGIWLVRNDIEKFRVPRLRPGFQVYSFLNTLPRAPICILPIVDREKQPNWARVNAARMLYQLNHKFPMVSGYSGFTPQLTERIESAILQNGITKATINRLARTGVKYVVVDGMLGDSSVLRRSLHSVAGVEVVYETGDEMVAMVPSGNVEHRLNVLTGMWSRGL